MRKPELKTATRVVTYWSCGLPRHRHMHFSVAKRCIEEQERGIRDYPKREEDDGVVRLRQRMYEDYIGGMSKKEIAQLSGYSLGYVSRCINHVAGDQPQEYKYHPLCIFCGEVIHTNSHNKEAHTTCREIQRRQYAVEYKRNRSKDENP